MTSTPPLAKRGRIWFEALAGSAPPITTGVASVLATDTTLDGETARLLAVVPDPKGRFPRAHRGEVGLEEGWALARQIRDAIALDAASTTRRAVIAVIDSRSQAYGRLEELFGIHLALAAAADAYVSARLAGHPVVGVIVGEAISGALLAHGIQAHRLLALDAPGVIVHAMHRGAAARITRRSLAQLDELGKKVLPMSYDIRDYAKLGCLHELIAGIDADTPSSDDVALVRGRIAAAIVDARRHGGGPSRRLENDAARATRAASLEVRRKLAEQWDGP